MNTPTPQDGGQKRSLLQSLELDTRLLGMIGAFVVICLVFNVITDGRFLTPRNIFNLSIQTVSVAIMATGMVFVIVTRHIDLSVGAVLAICSSVMGVMQVQLLPQVFGIGHPLVMPLTVIAGLLTGAAIGALNGWLVGYQRIPAFIVTLGGLLIWRNVGWYLTDGQTVGPLDQTFMLFGGVEGTVGSALSWALAVFFSVLAVFGLWRARQAKIRHEFPVKPLWAEGALMATAVVAILGFVAVLNSYAIPVGRLKREFDSRGEVMPEGYIDYFGLPISVLMLVVIVVVMTLIARKTRLGRYIFAAGGNPDAAELSGINTRMLTVKIFTLMGVLCAISAMVAQARLANHTNDIGSLDELRVIAAAVIGGTALAGGIGTIYGAVLGAVIMQSLQSGMAMVGVDAPFQNIVVGGVLVLAVWIDIQYRKRTGEKV
ncbi:sugar ABC transporter permease [Rhodobacter capsulatus]|uniref:Xylose transport system permease protein XylH n=1 Tax=Rhodobacter capsulatus (strain ATCC BAA-309 / NBRC 16581 / SB1003) TaxID=272942 RepID=D5AKE0_RHOCB|nr:sugar ABC transporter permease [Rhodobacter capsulatus]ADE83782.1 xylose ABC transporter, permease protein XylH [Rhodobacter capsulatus SB 1003]ETD03498.1 sugar ABC transporter permease [Rhodobacter capsulatus DE442]ETD80291.1 sugar ABC transporter permease [Rhodobacter capsulatus R121]ETE55558.1 sugar ABC transporter permease [Rhodobacter capsulatus Y262]MDS0925372.1 sugar ABC transporter permease [Rhodobacter capsulatus]